MECSGRLPASVIPAGPCGRATPSCEASRRSPGGWKRTGESGITTFATSRRSTPTRTSGRVRRDIANDELARIIDAAQAGGVRLRAVRGGSCHGLQAGRRDGLSRRGELASLTAASFALEGRRPHGDGQRGLQQAAPGRHAAHRPHLGPRRVCLDGGQAGGCATAATATGNGRNAGGRYAAGKGPMDTRDHKPPGTPGAERKRLLEPRRWRWPGLRLPRPASPVHFRRGELRGHRSRSARNWPAIRHQCSRSGAMPTFALPIFARLCRPCQRASGLNRKPSHFGQRERTISYHCRTMHH